MATSSILRSPSKKSPKKRKHASVKNDALPPATTSIRVEVTEENKEYDPVVVSFPRGVPTSISNPNGDDADGDDGNPGGRLSPPKFTYSKLKASSSRGRRVTGSDESCSYSAFCAGRGHDNRLTKLYVAVLDKRNKTLKLIPSAEKGTVFALDQEVKAYTPNVSSSSMGVGGGNDGSSKAVSASNRVQMLVESFGSKKKQKVMASRAANVVNINSVVGAGNVMMDSVVKQGGMISEGNREALLDGSKVLNPVEVALLQSRRNTLPPFDVNADSPHKVFSAQLIAESTAWEKCSKIVDKVLKKADETPEEHWADKLLGKGGHHESLRTLLKFHEKVSRKGGKILASSLDDCVTQVRLPAEVGPRIFELFSTPIEGREQGGYMMSRNQADKLCVWCLILYVIAASNGKDMAVSSINQLCKDMKLDDKKAALFLREAGFVVKKNGVGDLGVSLSVPLTFPPPKRGKKT
eukprot:scaffold14911_cov186-Alexandrium_tamarense.AAC.3